MRLRDNIAINIRGILRLGAIGLALFFLPLLSFGQCPNNNTFLSDLTPVSCSDTAISNCSSGGDFHTINVQAGMQYVFSTCCGFTNFDTQLTLYDSGGSVLAYNDDACGTSSRISWQATTTGTVTLVLDEFNCISNSSCATVCVYCLVPPANDDPCSAIFLPTNSSCNYQTFSNDLATGTAGIVNPSCGLFAGNDVWFTAVVPPSGSVSIDTRQGSMNDAAMAVYAANSCTGTFTEIACNDDSVFNSMPYIFLNSLTPGDTLYIRLWDYNSGGQGTFDICVVEPPPTLITDTTTYTPEELVQDVLLGACVDAFNVEFTGHPEAVGAFSGGVGLGITEGVLLTSGQASIAEGPNNVTDADAINFYPGDILLDSIAAPESTFDATVLEFDFVSPKDTVTFNYIFASEEYPEYVCCFNDVFGFFVSGPGYAPNTNVALIPGTSIPITIDNVNNVTNPTFSCNFACVASLPHNPAYYVDNTGGTLIQYDGFTVPLTATIVVNPCDTYHIKLAIADVGDPAYDSGVFLEAKSFKAGDEITIEAEGTVANTKNAFEGCNNGQFTFTRTDTTSNDTLYIPVTYSGTATMGVDYAVLPDTIVFFPGESSKNVSVPVVMDFQPEPSETIIVTALNSCSCNQTQRDTLYLFDNDTLTGFVGTPPDTLCQGQQVNLWATASGSRSRPYTFTWTAGFSGPTISSDSNFYLIPDSSTVFYSIINDFCGAQFVIDSVEITVVPAINAGFNVSSSAQCQSNPCFDFTNTATYTGAAVIQWQMGDNNTRSTDDVINYCYATPGTYTVTLTITENGCTDTYMETVTVHPEYTVTVDTTICSGNTYFAEGAPQGSSGIYYDTLNTVQGCDSLIITNLTVLPSPDTTVNVSICTGDTYFAGGAPQSSSGTYHDTLTTTGGCDSVLITHLTVMPVLRDTVPVNICDGESYFAGGVQQTLPGFYADTFANGNCDSIIVTDLSVLPNRATTIDTFICDGELYFAGGMPQDSIGTYYDTLVAANGCDSVVTTNLAVLPTPTTTIDTAICDGESYFAGGTLQTTPGVYLDTFVAANGCDSVVTTNLGVIPITISTIDANICQGDSIFVGGAYQSASGTYYDTVLSSQGCDSVLVTNVFVRNDTLIAVPVSICDGESYFAGGTPRTTTGMYYDTFATVYGCDSIIETDLTVLPNSSILVDTSICEGETIFAGGSLQDSTGVYYDTLVAANGCDSVITTDLTVLPNVVTLIDTSICEGETYFAGGGLQNTTGTYWDTLPAANGCDSIIQTDLFVIPHERITTDTFICRGETYFAGGAVQTSSGTYFDTLPAASGCDSIITTNLTVYNDTLVTVSVAICDGESYFAGGAPQTTPGIYYDTLASVYGCDSVVETNLSVLQHSFTTVDTFICAGDCYFAGGACQDTNGTYIDTLVAANGCDSVVSTNLTVRPNASTIIDVEICEDETYFAGGAPQDTSGTYYDTLPAANGCDSVITTNLTVKSFGRSYPVVEICEGESYFVGGANQTVSGTYNDTLRGANGCDSIIETELIVHPVYVKSAKVNICQGESYFVGGAVQTTSGLYYDTLFSSKGCDSVVVTNLQVDTLPEISGENKVICYLGSTQLRGPARYSSYLWTPTGETTRTIEASQGTYTLYVTDGNGCQGSATYIVDELDKLIIGVDPATITIELGDSADIVVYSSADSVGYLWQPANSVTCPACPVTSAAPSVNTVYRVLATDLIYGCLDSAAIEILVINEEKIFTPNAFTPNGDGFNDGYGLFVKGLKTIHWRIFDRWGELIFESKDVNDKWDGTYNGEPLKPGVFVYHAEIEFLDGEKTEVKGSITLIR